MDTKLRVTPERFAEGLALDEYEKSMSVNGEIFRDRYAAFRLEEEDDAFLRGYPQEVNVLVVTEDWCGDSMRYLPALARMARVAPRWNVRIFYRDENPDLGGMWLKHGMHRAIPVVVFFDSNMRELGHFIEKPSGAYTDDAQARESFVQQHPDLHDAHFRAAEMSETTYNLYVEHMQAHRASSVARWQQLFVQEVKNILTGADERTTLPEHNSWAAP